MKRRTPEDLAALPNARLIRRADALARAWHRTKSETTAQRIRCRLSVVQSAARMQDAPPAKG